MIALSPLSILDRGYSITRTIPDKRVVRGKDEVEKRQLLEIILANGGLEVSVEKKTDPETSFNRSP
jgi:exodeoxyribonuclease VII large subunit